MADNPAYNSERYGGVPVPAVRMGFSTEALDKIAAWVREPDEVCAECGHDIGIHGLGGCLLTGDVGFDVCPCSAEPQHSDPSDDRRDW